MINNAFIGHDIISGQLNVTCHNGFEFADRTTVKYFDCLDCENLWLGWDNATSDWKCIGNVSSLVYCS